MDNGSFCWDEEVMYMYILSFVKWKSLTSMHRSICWADGLGCYSRRPSTSHDDTFRAPCLNIQVNSRSLDSSDIWFATVWRTLQGNIRCMVKWLDQVPCVHSNGRYFLRKFRVASCNIRTPNTCKQHSMRTDSIPTVLLAKLCHLSWNSLSQTMHAPANIDTHIFQWLQLFCTKKNCQVQYFQTLFGSFLIS